MELAGDRPPRYVSRDVSLCLDRGGQAPALRALWMPRGGQAPALRCRGMPFVIRRSQTTERDRPPRYVLRDSLHVWIAGDRPPRYGPRDVSPCIAGDRPPRYGLNVVFFNPISACFHSQLRDRFQYPNALSTRRRRRLTNPRKVPPT